MKSGLRRILQPANGFFVRAHGWWEAPSKQAHFNVPILGEPFKTEPEVNAAMDARIHTLESEGWIHKFTTAFDPNIGGGRGVRI